MALLVTLFFLAAITSSHALPLSTNSRWIVDDNGQRVKLACVNWISHLEVVVAEGLHKQPVDAISHRIRDMGFNCVRLTWPIYLATNHTLASLTVRQSFQDVGLPRYVFYQVQANNPAIVNLTLIHAFQEVVRSLTKYKVMVILDNHVSKPMWCCNVTDGNGFFGDRYFDPRLWIKGLTKMATLFRDNPNVVAMSLRNELRGANQNANDWYRYMQRGANAVHKANPNVLVILSGLMFDTDLSFMKQRPVSVSFTGKLVFEAHQYVISLVNQEWSLWNANKVCGYMRDKLMSKVGFLVNQGFPLFVSEWGMQIPNSRESEKRYFNCILAWFAEHDLDWAFWQLGGSSYRRNNRVEPNETWAVLDSNWSRPRDNGFLHRISLIQHRLRGPETSFGKKHKIVFHPLTGLCILGKPGMEKVHLGNCSKSNHWSYAHHTLQIVGSGSFRCLKAQGLNLPARLTIHCSTTEGTSWSPVSDSKLHLATTFSNNTTACLDVDSQNNLLTTACKCFESDYKCDPRSQWFKIADVSDL